MKVIHGTATDRQTSPLEDAYVQFRLDRVWLAVAAAVVLIEAFNILSKGGSANPARQWRRDAAPWSDRPSPAHTMSPRQR
jgi:hypothetical protein